MTRKDFVEISAIASKLARSDSSEWNRNSGTPLPVSPVIDGAASQSRSMLYSPPKSPFLPIDRAIGAHVKLDVIFHDCKIWRAFPEKIRGLLRENVYESLRADNPVWPPRAGR